MTAIAVINESAVSCDTDALARLAAFLFPLVRIADDCELCITIVDEPRMEELHIQWMDLPDATDVLSFPMDELRSAEPDQEPPSGILGDIVLCPEFARKQAAEAGRSLDAELQFLTTHGILHLLGHDHMTPEEYDVMFAFQDELLAKWNAS
ncbi:MAG: rRNA maturation RNase YbeY [Candidatus Nanopelagicales bacterium]